MKVKCGSCKTYIDKEDARQVGIQNFCADCKPEPIARTQMKKKPKKNPMESSLRDEVIEADGGRCRFAGCRENLHVHHIEYGAGRREHVRGNLITLCNVHHDTVHSDKGVFQPLCFEVVKRRDEAGDKQITIERLRRDQAKVS